MEEKKVCFWCSCGKSQKVPYCDGSHRGTDKRPVRFEDEAHSRPLCLCQKTKTPPYCDGSHAQ